MEQEKIKYILYARKSSESEDRQILSIDSQTDELKRVAEAEGLEIVEILKESKSAKAPGRVVFSEMIKKINKGEARGIICWKLDRLARNPIDGGTILWALQTGEIKHIRTFERNYLPTDNVLVMSVEFGMANQFIRDLSLNTKRGLRKKVEMGCFPSTAPLGYLNNKYSPIGQREIIPDPERFEIVRKIFKTILTGQYNVAEVYKMAVNEWGLTIKNGGKPAKSAIYTTLTNPFYYGYFRYGGETHKGNHEPMITRAEFDLIQSILKKRTHTRAQRHIFAFTGLMKCTECNSGITAYEKIKPSGWKAIYYACTKRKNLKCSQKPIRENVLENQILKILDDISLPQEIHEWALRWLKIEQSQEKQARNKTISYQRRAYDEVLRSVDNLIQMRADKSVSEEEFQRNIKPLREEKVKLEAFLRDAEWRAEKWIDYAIDYLRIAGRVKDAFINGDIATKRTILNSISAEILIKDKQVQIKLESPFMVLTSSIKGILANVGKLELTKSKINTNESADFDTTSLIGLPVKDAFRTLNWHSIKHDLEPYISFMSQRQNSFAI